MESVNGRHNMSAIINIDKAHSTLPPLPALRTRLSDPITASIIPAHDRVEWSQSGRALAGTVDDPSTRVARIESIRSEIAAGTYETPERIAGTVSRLLDIVG